MKKYWRNPKSPKKRNSFLRLLCHWSSGIIVTPIAFIFSCSCWYQRLAYHYYSYVLLLLLLHCRASSLHRPYTLDFVVCSAVASIRWEIFCLVAPTERSTGPRGIKPHTIVLRTRQAPQSLTTRSPTLSKISPKLSSGAEFL